MLLYSQVTHCSIQHPHITEVHTIFDIKTNISQTRSYSEHYRTPCQHVSLSEFSLVRDASGVLFFASMRTAVSLLTLGNHWKVVQGRRRNTKKLRNGFFVFFFGFFPWGNLLFFNYFLLLLLAIVSCFILHQNNPTFKIPTTLYEPPNAIPLVQILVVLYFVSRAFWKNEKKKEMTHRYASC